MKHAALETNWYQLLKTATDDATDNKSVNFEGEKLPIEQYYQNDGRGLNPALIAVHSPGVMLFWWMDGRLLVKPTTKEKKNHSSYGFFKGDKGRYDSTSNTAVVYWRNKDPEMLSAIRKQWPTAKIRILEY